VSRKGFLGRLTGREAPADRAVATAAANVLAFERGARVFRVHDVAAAADFLAVRAALRGEREVPPSLALPDELRHEPPSG
ncbi:MAG TPA: dihydropteroate synthase, partial [Solirubrobacteraceae bacterium]|nr:dihydropteroate synthase [Solirubrobacteraceae bacterium]